MQQLIVHTKQFCTYILPRCPKSPPPAHLRCPVSSCAHCYMLLLVLLWLTAQRSLVHRWVKVCEGHFEGLPRSAAAQERRGTATACRQTNEDVTSCMWWGTKAVKMMVSWHGVPITHTCTYVKWHLHIYKKTLQYNLMQRELTCMHTITQAHTYIISKEVWQVSHWFKVNQPGPLTGFSTEIRHTLPIHTYVCILSLFTCVQRRSRFTSLCTMLLLCR